MNKRDHVMNELLLGAGIGVLLEPGGGDGTVMAMIAVGVPVTLGALVPDIDAVMGRHRKTLHNLPVLATFALFPVFFGNLQYVWIGVLTHFFLDVAGATRGIALFYPLLGREYGLPVGVPVDSRKADVVTLIVTAAELALVAAVIALAPVEWLELLFPTFENLEELPLREAAATLPSVEPV